MAKCYEVFADLGGGDNFSFPLVFGKCYSFIIQLINLYALHEALNWSILNELDNFDMS